MIKLATVDYTHEMNMSTEQWFMGNKIQGNVISPPTENGSRCSPISDFFTMLGNGKGNAIEMECELAV